MQCSAGWWSSLGASGPRVGRPGCICARDSGTRCCSPASWQPARWSSSPSKGIGYRFPPMQANALDHVALWVADRDAIAGLACEHLGMHVIERTDDFTLIGADARRGKLTLFAAEGPRERGVLERVVLRVGDLAAALAALPGDLAVDHADGVARFDGPEGLGL